MRDTSLSGFRSHAKNKSVSRSRDDSNAAKDSTPSSITSISFPEVYEQAWGASKTENGSVQDNRTDLHRARIFLLRFTQLNPNATFNSELQSIVMNKGQYNTILAIIEAIQVKIFDNRHTSFETNPLLQCTRYILIKTCITDRDFSDKTQRIVDFFFDPTIARNLDSLPPNAVTYVCPVGRLKVCIVGGGPTALASAISLAEKGQGKVEIHMYERRWTLQQGPNGTNYVDYPQSAKRRDQVVTLQDSVTTLMSRETFQALFAGRPERVWPGSANIQIRKVEDRLLKRCQDPQFRGTIHLHAQGLTIDTLSKTGDFHVLLGADGAASWVRKSYFHGYENERGRSYALGLAFNRPAGLPWSQSLNMFLTLGQTRYLLNASDHDGRGYLNMQLTEDEWHKMVSVDGEPVTFGRPGCLRLSDGTLPPGFEEGQVFAPSENRESTLWQTIEDGLKLFGFKESEVINVVRIPIVVQAVREGVQYLPSEDFPNIRRPRALVAVAGDAAMTVHFWPGRGLNSGIKSGLALGDEIVYALNHGQFAGLSLDSMKEYNSFIMKLQGREHEKRSIPILNQSGTPEVLGWLLEKAHSVPDEVAIEWLVGAMVQIGSRLETRPDWPFEPVANVEPQIRIVLRQLRSLTLREMAVSFPWPTREMGGAEVLPIRSMKAEEKQTWLNGLWKLLKDDKTTSSKAQSRVTVETKSAQPSKSLFEAPRQSSNDKGKSLQPPSQSDGGLRRSGATRSLRAPSISGLSLQDTPSSRSTSPVPERSRSPGPDYDSQRLNANNQRNGYREPSPAPGDIGLVRLLSTTKRPGKAVLSDALSLALFRVNE